MATKLKVTDLPVELLVKIFSFLDSKKLLNLCTVCSKFNAAAKDPSLWRRWEFKFNGNDSRKISSFCSLFSQYPFFRELSIIDLNSFSIGALDYTLVNSINHLFENLKNLSCLNLKMNLANIVLPPSLRHFTCKLSYEICKKYKFPFVDQCPKIERLHLEAVCYARLTNAVTLALLKYQLTLSALHLEIAYFEEEWIPLIENCLSLKELGLELEYDKKVNLAKLFGSSLSSRLELLHVKNIDTLQSFDGFEFPELKVLTIESLEDLMVIIPVIKRMPKIHSLHFFGKVRTSNVEDICSAVKSYETLRYLLIGLAYQPINVFYTISRQLNEGSSEENQWRISREYDIRKFLMPKCKCKCLKPT